MDTNSNFKWRYSWTIFIGSPIYEAIGSIELINGVYTLIGICIPISIEYILDLSYYGSMDKESGYIHRGMLILSAWIPNILVLCVIISNDNPLYVPLLYQVRISAYLICIFTYLHEFGGPVADGHLFYFLVLCSLVSTGMKFFASMSTLPIISTLSTIVFVVGSLTLVVFCYKWIRHIRTKLSNDSLSRGDMICTCYLITFVLGTIGLLILRLVVGINLDANSTTNDLVAHQTFTCAIVLVLTMTHGRFLRFDMNRTQVNLSFSFFC